MVTIRDAHRDDADALAEAHVEGWRVGYRGVVRDSYLDDPQFRESRYELWRAWNWNEHGTAALFVAELDGVPKGFGLCGPERGVPECSGEGDAGLAGSCARAAAAPRGEVYSFYLHPSAWGSGAAPALISRCEEWLVGSGFEEAVLWVLRDNSRGRAFYEKAGWLPSGRELSFEIGAALGDPHTLVEVEYQRTLL